MRKLLKIHLNIFISLIKSELHSLEIVEHAALANNEYLAQLNEILRLFHIYFRNFPLVYHKDLFNPELQQKSINSDLFPIRTTLKFDNDQLGFIFDEREDLVKNIMIQLGFGLELKKSNGAKKDKNKGVFLRTTNYQKIPAGTLLGFVPGVYREKESYDEKISKKQIIRSNNMNFQMSAPIINENFNFLTIQEVENSRQDKK